MEASEFKFSHIKNAVAAGLAVSLDPNPDAPHQQPTTDLAALREALDAAPDANPWCSMDSLVAVILRDPDDAASDGDLLQQAYAYGWRETCVRRLASGHLSLVYRRDKSLKAPIPAIDSDRISASHIYIEPWCTLMTGGTWMHLPGAIVNGRDFVSMSSFQFADLPEIAYAKWTEQARALLAIHEKSVADVSAAIPKLPRHYFEKLADMRPRFDQAELVEGLLDREGLSSWIGAPKAGKTSVLTSLAYAVGTGEAFFGRQVERGLAVYLAAEGGSSTRKRFVALRTLNGLKAQGAYVALMPCPVDLGKKDGDAYHILQLIRDAEKEFGQRAVVVFVDTIARSTPGMEESDAKGMGEFISNLDYLRRETGAHIACAHHTGKNKAMGGRGSSALPAAVDSEFIIDDGKVINSLQRDRELAPPIGFELLPVDFGIDRRGKVVRSIVAIERNITTAADNFAQKPLPPSAQNALSALQNLTFGDRKAPVAAWRDEFIRLHHEDRKIGRTAFGRAFARLQSDARVKLEGDYASVI